MDQISSPSVSFSFSFPLYLAVFIIHWQTHIRFISSTIPRPSQFFTLCAQNQNWISKSHKCLLRLQLAVSRVFFDFYFFWSFTATVLHIHRWDLIVFSIAITKKRWHLLINWTARCVCMYSFTPYKWTFKRNWVWTHRAQKQKETKQKQIST